MKLILYLLEKVMSGHLEPYFLLDIHDETDSYFNYSNIALSSFYNKR